ncbi:MAG: CapA family protein [Candidatus Saccharibacteria bacterium]|nr:CapA family protein [Candidatus Saccharibacteria bacterium]
MHLSKKHVLIACVSVAVVACGVIAGTYYRDNVVSKSQEAEQRSAREPTVEPQKSTVRLLATGDMIAHDSINQNAKQGDKYDYAALMSDMKPYFQKGDINFCNQATPAGGSSFGISGYPIFNAPLAFPRGIEEVGCNLINIGTNHTYDKGKDLVDATVKAWDDRDVLAVAGANRNQSEQNQPRIFEVNGMTFAFVSYTNYTNEPIANDYSVNQYSKALAEQQINTVRDEADLVIASMRWGTEYADRINDTQEKIARDLANFGADVVLGHGTHVLQPVKKLTSNDGREVYVWYGLGNFLNSQLEAEALIGGFASMDIDIETASITEVGFLPVYQHYEWTPAQKAAGNLLARTNFRMVPLDEAGDLLAKPNAHLDTNVKAQTDRVRQILNRHTDIPILKSGDF